MKKIDMSEKAVWQRLRQVDQLHELSLALMKAGKAHFARMGKFEKYKDSGEGGLTPIDAKLRL